MQNDWHTGQIATEYLRKGRPGYDDPRCFDWQAVLADGDQERNPIGHGVTEAAAVLDLIIQLEERE